MRPKRQTTLMVSTELLGLMSIQTIEELNLKHNLFAMNFIVEVRPNVAFTLIVKNYGTGEYGLSKNQVLAKLLRHACAVVPTSIRIMEILGVTVSSI